MILEFRETGWTLAPGPGELYLRPAAPEDLHRLDRAGLALAKGVKGFVCGAGTVERIVVPVDPTLDDMVAALLVERELEGAPRPPAADFARYTATLRKGLRPTAKVPLAESPEGIFAHFRQEAGDPLSDPKRAAVLLAGWRRMAEVLWPALCRGADPHGEALFGEGTPFEAERQFLHHDEHLYEHDRQVGEPWLIRLPGGQEPVPGLLLRVPKSSLFKFWARTDPLAPGGKGFRFLAVWWDKEAPYEWIFSTNPLFREPIDSLARVLQEHEDKRRPRTTNEPSIMWYDGHAFAGTLVGSPKAGTVLKVDDVLGVVKSWGKVQPLKLSPTPLAGGGPALARPPEPNRLWPKLAVAAVVLLAIGGALAWYLRPVPADVAMAAAFKGIGSASQTLTLQDGSESQTEELVFEVKEDMAAKVWLSFPLITELPFQKEVQVTPPDGQAGQTLKVNWDADKEVFRSEPLFTRLRQGKNRLAVTFRQPTTTKKPIDVQVVWNPAQGMSLHVFTVGVSTYRHIQGELKFPAKDATAVAEAFRKQGNLLFDVKVHKPLTDNDATCANIQDEMGRFADEVRQDQSLKLAIVFFSGHGSVEEKDYFVFWPVDYKPDSPSTHLHFGGSIEASLKKMGCPVVLILDACHSGQAAQQVALISKGGLEETVGKFSRQKQGLMVLASSAADELSREALVWEHGALALALLEILNGHKLYPRKGEPLEPPYLGKGDGSVISLRLVEDYAHERVKELVKEVSRGGLDQTVVLKGHPSLDPRFIPIAVRSPRP
jgi:hypothetical protein